MNSSLWLSLCVLLSAPSCASQAASVPQGSDDPSVILSVGLPGSVKYLVPGRTTWQTAKPGDQLSDREEIACDADGQALIQHGGGSQVSLAATTRVVIRSYAGANGALTQGLVLRAGAISCEIKKAADVFVETSTCDISASDARFAVTFDAKAQTTAISVANGSVIVSPTDLTVRSVRLTAGNTVTVGEHYRTRFTKYESPPPPIVAPPVSNTDALPANHYLVQHFGIHLGVVNGRVEVTELKQGGLGEKTLRLQVGDELVAVNDTATKGLDPSQLRSFFQPRPGRTLVLEFERTTGAARSVLEFTYP